MSMVLLGVKVPPELAAEYDAAWRELGYATRSDALRDEVVQTCKRAKALRQSPPQPAAQATEPAPRVEPTPDPVAPPAGPPDELTRVLESELDRFFDTTIDLQIKQIADLGEQKTVGLRNLYKAERLSPEESVADWLRRVQGGAE